MPISFTCPHCGRQSDVADKFAGQTGPCVGCGLMVTVPGGKTSPPFAAAPIATASPARRSGMGVAGIVLIVVCAVMLLPCTGILIALLLPAVQSAREAARRAQCTNNLKQIAIALHNYHDVYKTFPPAYIPDDNGEPKHSWRVLILPFMEQQALYEQYDFDEPWDSPHNQIVTSATIPVYQCPSASDLSTETNYMVLTGQGTLFEKGEACSIADITDGTSNTILVVEVAGTGVSWANPQDLDVSSFVPPFSPPGPNAPGSYHSGGLNVAFSDGSVQFLSDSMNPATVRSLATRSGGEPIPAY